MSQNELLLNIFDTTPDNKDVRKKLQSVTAEFPYFTIAQYLLLKHTDIADEEYNRTAGKVALHFNNPFYLNYLLNKKDSKDSGLVEPAFENNNIARSIEQIRPNEPAEKQEILFEPLHTTDYFASQGIRLSEEVKADDKLGKQLKSFTDWLKTMKKLHDQKLPEGNEQLDLVVQHIAEKSNKEAEIITESMAEVFASQGKTGRAREIYNKLSLLDPSKSAYFAAKIELLKEI